MKRANSARPFPFLRRRGDVAAAAVPEPSLGVLVATVFLPFAAGYLLSYLFRTVNALVAPNLTATLGLGAADLGLLTSAYFLSFALAQVPLGILLDRVGPRRVQSVLFLVAGVGSLLFALGQTTATLATGRILIGLGVSGALMAGLKSIVQWFPKQWLGLANGGFIMFGGLGAYAASTPSELILQATDWRTLFVMLAAATVAVAGLIAAVVPERGAGGGQAGLREIVTGLRHVYGDPFFWRVAPASGCAIGAAWAVQGLWAGRWLADVEHFGRPEVVAYLSAMAGALCVGSLAVGIAVDRLKQAGVQPTTTMAAAFAMFAALQAVVVLRLPVPAYIVWPAFGAFASGTVFGYTLLGAHFTKEFTGRANTALNLIHMSMAFFFQSAMGMIVSLWPAENAHYPAVAYQAAFSLLLGLQVASLVWMTLAGRRHAIRRAGVAVAAE